MAGDPSARAAGAAVIPAKPRIHESAARETFAGRGTRVAAANEGLEEIMLSRRRLLLSSVGAALAAPQLAPRGFAQESWPARDIHTICMFPPGSGADIL